MVRKNHRIIFRKKRNMFFTGVRKQDLRGSEGTTVSELGVRKQDLRGSEGTTVSELDAFVPYFPPRKIVL